MTSVTHTDNHTHSEPGEDLGGVCTGGNKLVLCFDGTGNKFTGGTSDTNIVKIYQMLDREAPGQYHYYQPGIGTYTAGESNLSSTPWGRFQRHISQLLDEALGTSFGHHVISGYKFIMRYYTPGDDIYILGFSRGAYTARFLAQMVQTIGLLSRGNEEMIPFAWKTYADYERRRSDVSVKEEEFMNKFKNTFCRQEVDIKFLGLFDSVNSVGSFEIPGMRRSFPYSACPPAQFVRHAVSIDERRAKFRPALFDHRSDHDVLEMWFPGNHGDVGGGWEPPQGKELLSDIPLAWMVSELRNLPVQNKLQWKQRELDSHDLKQCSRLKAVNSEIHDALAIGRGWGWLSTLGWWIIEILPIFSRRELVNDRWVTQRIPPNAGATRDIPPSARIHESAHIRERANIGYAPSNDGYRKAKPTEEDEGYWSSGSSGGSPVNRIKRGSSWRMLENVIESRRWEESEGETAPLLNGS